MGGRGGGAVGARHAGTRQHDNSRAPNSSFRTAVYMEVTLDTAAALRSRETNQAQNISSSGHRVPSGRQ